MRSNGPERLSEQSSVPAADVGIRPGGVPAVPDWGMRRELMSQSFRHSARSNLAGFLDTAPANEEQKVRVKNVKDIVGDVPL